MKIGLQRQPPDIFIHPEIKGVRMMDFTSIDEVLEQSQPAVDELIETLQKLQNTKLFHLGFARILVIADDRCIRAS